MRAKTIARKGEMIMFPILPDIPDDALPTLSGPFLNYLLAVQETFEAMKTFVEGDIAFWQEILDHQTINDSRTMRLPSLQETGKPVHDPGCALFTSSESWNRWRAGTMASQGYNIPVLSDPDRDFEQDPWPLITLSDLAPDMGLGTRVVESPADRYIQ